MSSRDPEIEDYFLTGLISVLILGLVGILVGLCIVHRDDAIKVIGFFVLVPSLIFGTGYFVEHAMKAWREWRCGSRLTKGMPIPDELLSCGIPILDKLHRLEVKYQMSTLDFIYQVREYGSNLHSIRKIDNLDYIEWFSLINDLPYLLNDEQIKEEVSQNV